jgi:hypothetical protein
MPMRRVAALPLRTRALAAHELTVGRWDDAHGDWLGRPLHRATDVQAPVVVPALVVEQRDGMAALRHRGIEGTL